jgi:hypothetical protein
MSNKNNKVMLIKQPYGGGQRYHCPKCDVYKNEHGIEFVQWTNGSTSADYCSNPIHVFEDIAHEHLCVDIFKHPKEFCDCSVKGLHDALSAAYEAGKASRNP